MARATKKPTTAEQKTPDSERTIADLAREWRVVEAKMHLEVTETDNDEEVSRITDRAHGRQLAIVEEIGSRRNLTTAEAAEALALVLADHKDDPLLDSDTMLIRAAMKSLQDAPRAAARPAARPAGGLTDTALFAAVSDAEGDMRRVFDLALILNDYMTRMLPITAETKNALSWITSDLMETGRRLSEHCDEMYAAVPGRTQEVAR